MLGGITNHLMTDPSGNKINCFPRDQSLSVYKWAYICKMVIINPLNNAFTLDLSVLTPTPFLFLESLPVENVRLPGNVPLLPIECSMLKTVTFNS